MTPWTTATVPVELAVYTDALVIRGTTRVPDRPLAETLATLPDGILELEDVTMDEHGSRGRPVGAPVAHVRAESIVFVL